jgi:hypothetical protein
VAGSPLRVLQVLFDTDLTDPSERALDLHAALARRGIEVRTVALGAGRRGGLDDRVPALAPAASNLSARTQLRREARWADVVALVGDAVGVATSRLLRGAPPMVGACDAPMPGPPPTGLAGLVVTALHDLPSPPEVDTASAVGVAPGAAPVPVVVLPPGVDTRRPPTSTTARRVARRELALPEDGPVVRIVGAGADAAAWHRAVVGAGAAVVDEGHPGAGEGGRDDDTGELREAAVDVLAVAGGTEGVPPRWVLAGAASGQAVVTVPGPIAELLGDAAVVLGDEGPGPALAALADPTERARRGAAVAEVVRRRCDLDEVAGRWEGVLSSLLDR